MFAQKNIIHRDVRIRNIFVNYGNDLKIGDFGLSRVIPYGQTTWRMTSPSKLPIRYLSPEAMDDKVFSQASDVWAFGVTMWEIMTYAETPYKAEVPKLENVKQYVRSGGRLNLPSVRYSQFC